jgi:hypothetical protein
MDRYDARLEAETDSPVWIVREVVTTVRATRCFSAVIVSAMLACPSVAVGGSGQLAQLHEPTSSAKVVSDAGTLRVDGRTVVLGATLARVTAVLGAGTRVHLDSSSGGIDCYAEWAEFGIEALFQSFGDHAKSGCSPAASYHLRSATLRGPGWSTTRGLRTHDSLHRLQALYPSARAGRSCAANGVGTTKWWGLVRRHDANGFPGNRVCVLAALVAHGHVTAFNVATQNSE